MLPAENAADKWFCIQILSGYVEIEENNCTLIPMFLTLVIGHEPVFLGGRGVGCNFQNKEFYTAKTAKKIVQGKSWGKKSSECFLLSKSYLFYVETLLHKLLPTRKIIHKLKVRKPGKISKVSISSTEVSLRFPVSKKMS